MCLSAYLQPGNAEDGSGLFEVRCCSELEHLITLVCQRWAELLEGNKSGMEGVKDGDEKFIISAGNAERCEIFEILCFCDDGSGQTYL